MGLHITLKELKAVRLKVETFLSQLRGRRVLLWEDNMAVKHILTNLTTKSPEMMRELRKLWYLWTPTTSHSAPGTSIRSASNPSGRFVSREKSTAATGCSSITDFTRPSKNSVYSSWAKFGDFRAEKKTVG